MSGFELYSLRFDGKDVLFDECTDAELRAALQGWDGSGPLPNTGQQAFELQYVAGHEETLLCRVYRKEQGPGGLIVLYDATGLLLLAHAPSNLALVEGAGHFARMTTYIRYGADIFEHGDEDDD